MKKTLLFLVAILFLNNSFAQEAPPEMFKFQAFVVDNKGKAVKDQMVGIEILILRDAITGTLVYNETFSTMTSSTGLINLEIGNGSPTYGVFSDIPWGDGFYFLELRVDISGGTNYSSMGGSQLLSVPYALYTKTAKELDGPNDTDNQNEIQTLELNGNLLSLSDGGEVILPAVGNFSFYYADRDGDNYGDNWNVVYADIVPAGYVLNGGDCNDLDASINPGATEIPEDGIDQDCDGMELYLDKDNDGFTSDVDCDDFDDTVYPGAEEVCDGKDNNCDGAVDNDCVIGDCVALWASVLQYVDVNCENLTDINCVSSSPNFGLLQFCTNMTCIINIALTGSYPPEFSAWSYDEAAAWLISQCGITDDDGDGYSPENGDCNDLDDTVYPGAPEICEDGIDQDCNGSDKLCNDEDNDGFIDVNFGGDDCDDTNPEVNPEGFEECDGLDNNCDGIVDNVRDGVDGATYYRDQDSDGWGSDSDIVYSCEPVEGYVLEISGDCDDTDPTVHPLAEELCDGLDNDCDGQIDETCDEDGDGFTIGEGDCDDTDPEVYPGAPEICGDDVDNNCDGLSDETCELDEDGDGFNILEGDCDDNDPDVYPGAPEICFDGIDNNCDDQIDEGCPEVFIQVELTWNTPGDPDQTDIEGTDLDLHFRDVQGDWFSEWDCYSLNPSPNWGDLGSSQDDPLLVVDDTDGLGPEIIILDPSDIQVYMVGVEYFDDRSFGLSYATVRIYLNGVLLFEEIDHEMFIGEFWEVATIDGDTVN